MLDDKTTKVLLVVLTIAFAGWSASVWRAVDKIEKVAADISGVAAAVSVLEHRMTDNENRDQIHANRAWHEQAGQAIIKLQQQSHDHSGGS